MGHVVVVGSTNTDMTVRVSRLPRAGETVLGGEFYRAGGGKGANQAVAAARAGGKVTFVGRTGEDGFGDEMRERLDANGIDLQYLLATPDTPSGVAMIVVDDDGENAIAVAPGANAALTAADVEAAESAIEEADVLLAQLEIPMDAVDCALSLARAHNVPTILDPAPAQELVPSLLEHVSILTPNIGEATTLTGIAPEDDKSRQRAAEHLHREGAETVILTLGAEGAYVVSEDRRFHVPARAVDATDTTAAGDVFAGTLSSVLSDGGTLRRAVRLANTAAALSVTEAGAQSSIPAREEIIEAEKED